MSVDRRDFLRLGAGAGLLAAGACAVPAASPGAGEERVVPGPAGVSLPRAGSDVVVVGAGAFGVWTAYHLKRLGASVTLVDLYGPGNSRATSGGETRGIRSSYGDNALWVDWAGEAIRRWARFDEEVARPTGVPLFFRTGDLILRRDWDNLTTESRATWDAQGVPYEVLGPDEMRYRWPHIELGEMALGLYEPRAGVGRARRACELVADLFVKDGGKLLIGRAVAPAGGAGPLDALEVEPHGPLRADLFVFALGPWFGKAFPELMGNRLRIPMGHVFYYGVPAGEPRWTHPHMPSYNVPGVTGWPALPVDSRGFRVRTGGRAADDPDASVRYIEPDGLERPRSILETYFPGLVDAPLLETRACHYELTTDRNWIIDRHPDRPNVWLAGGGNAEGFKFSIVLGEYIARRMLGDDPHPELAERFALKPETFDPSE